MRTPLADGETLSQALNRLEKHLTLLPELEQQVALEIFQTTISRIRKGFKEYGPMENSLALKNLIDESFEESADVNVYLGAACILQRRKAGN